MTQIRPVVLCGGSGTRLWPLSRRLEPKQFQRLLGETSLFQETIERFSNEAFERATVLVNAAQQPRVQMELEQLDLPQGAPLVIVEPVMRSTAPAIAAAATVIGSEDPDAVMLVVPSDHRIGRPDRLLDAYLAALPFVEAGGIALFGIRPTAPETGFGYIRAGEGSSHGVEQVDAFIEKPDVERAIQLLADPRHTWNSGIFMFRASTILEELANFAPAVLEAAANSALRAERRDNRVELAPCFAEAPEISIDHAVMEHSRALGVVPVSPEWSDLGSFEALWEVGEQNAEENVVLGEAVLKDVRRSYVRASNRLVSVVGLSNVVIVDTEDALLVASRAQSQDVKFIAQHLARTGHPAADQHAIIRRSGGDRRTVDAKQDYRVDRLTVLPGREMPLDSFDQTGRCIATLLSGEAVLFTTGTGIPLSIGSVQDLPDDPTMVLVNPGSMPADLLLTTLFAESLSGASAETDQRKVS
jgi:mannose-1-phosphate guanylyltransferase/mannose-6-phosphate isomerase